MFTGWQRGSATAQLKTGAPLASVLPNPQCWGGGPSLSLAPHPEGAALTFHTHLKAPLILLHLLSPTLGLFLKVGFTSFICSLNSSPACSLGFYLRQPVNGLEAYRGTVLRLLF